MRIGFALVDAGDRTDLLAFNEHLPPGLSPTSSAAHFPIDMLPHALPGALVIGALSALAVRSDAA